MRLILLISLLFLTNQLTASAEFLELKNVTEVYEITIDGQLFSNEVSVGQVVKSRCNDGVCPWFIRLQFWDGKSYKWNASVDNYNDAVLVDPELEPRWLREQ